MQKKKMLANLLISREWDLGSGRTKSPVDHIPAVTLGFTSQNHFLHLYNGDDSSDG